MNRHTPHMNLFPTITDSGFFMVFYTRVLGINGAVVGTMFLLTRYIDGFTDVTMGRIIDLCKPAKHGKFRPCIQRMCVPVVLAGILLFIPAAANLPMHLRIACIYVTYLLWGSVCYTSINIPYGSMASVITSDPIERAGLSTFCSVGASLAGVIINAIVLLVIYVTAADGSKAIAENRIMPMVFISSVRLPLSAISCATKCLQSASFIGAIPARSLKGSVFRGTYIHHRHLPVAVCPAPDESVDLLHFHLYRRLRRGPVQPRHLGV